MKLRDIRQEMIAIIEEGRLKDSESETIAAEILEKVVPIKEVVAVNDGTARLLNINDFILLAGKALRHASFEGGIVVLPTGEKVVRRTRSRHI